MSVAMATLALMTGDLADKPDHQGPAGAARGTSQRQLRDYRILYRIGDEVITILDVEHRRDAYRP